jgi:hypothetical protein
MAIFTRHRARFIFLMALFAAEMVGKDEPVHNALFFSGMVAYHTFFDGIAFLPDVFSVLVIVVAIGAVESYIIDMFQMGKIDRFVEFSSVPLVFYFDFFRDLVDILSTPGRHEQKHRNK